MGACLQIGQCEGRIIYSSLPPTLVVHFGQCNKKQRSKHSNQKQQYATIIPFFRTYCRHKRVIYILHEDSSLTETQKNHFKSRLMSQSKSLMSTFQTWEALIDKLFSACSRQVHKLHPVDYKTVKVTKKWLLEACLRQYKFVEELPLQKVDFHNCYESYLQFLFILSQTKCNHIVVPNKKADILWHSHMQNNQKCQADMIVILKKVLNHRDDYSPAQLKSFQKSANKLWNQYVGSRKQKPANPRPASNNVNNIVY